MRRTRIVCTLGPSSVTPEAIGELMDAGMDVARLNFSHGTREDHTEAFARVRRAAAERQRHVAILQDLQGPKMRLGAFSPPVALVDGTTVRLSPTAQSASPVELPVGYPRLAQDVSIGGRVLIDDGRVALEVDRFDGNDVICRVLVGGIVSSQKGINLPGQAVSTPSLMPKDLVDLRMGLRLGVDYVAVSFVRRAADLEVARRVMDDEGTRVPLIAKIERPEALEDLTAILKTADGVMVARGDLGVEMPIEQVPLAQKRIIGEANRLGKPVVTATQMLESMIKSAGPTRAEASDVANAVIDGTDAVMLSAETAIGDHPALVVRTMSRICAVAESTTLDAPVARPEVYHDRSIPHAIARAACLTAGEIGATAVIGFTRSGFTALLLSKERPTRTIIAVTPSAQVARLTALYRGVVPVVVEEPTTLDETLAAIDVGAVRSGLVARGDRAVVVCRASGQFETGTNLMQIHTVGGTA